MKHKKQLSVSPYFFAYSTLTFIFLGFLFLICYISDTTRAAKVDRYILYSIDDILRYCLIRKSLTDILIFFSIYLKLLYAILATLFYQLIPLGMSSLRIMNSIFSMGILFVLYKLTKLLNFEEKFSILSISLTAVFPIYFLLSISTYAETIFSFFLISSLYAIYKERYCLFSFLISFIPLIRQPGKGLLYLELAIFVLLFKKPRLKYFLILLSPTALWMLFNVIFFKRPLMEIFASNLVDRAHAPLDSIIFFSQINFMYYIGFYPIIILALIGIAIKFFDKRYVFILSYVIVQFLFIALLNIIDYQTSGTLQQEYRVFMPIIPLLVIYQALAIEWILKRLIRLKKTLPMLSALVLTFIFIFSLYVMQLKQFQKSPKLIGDSLSYEQDKNLKIASLWLIDFLKENNIDNVYGEAIELIREPIRKLWMYIPRNKNMYFSYMNFQVFDPLTWRVLPNHRVNGLLVTMFKKSKESFIEPHYQLIKSFPEIPLYFYIID